MGLEVKTQNLIFVNIKEGQFYIKPKGEEKQFFAALSGTIAKVEFETDEYEGKSYELCKVYVADGNDLFCLQMRVLSGYFRDFVNSLRTGNPTERLRIMPNYKNEKAGMFIQQNSQWLKRYSTKEHRMDVPELKQINFRGTLQYDGTAQVEFWKEWLLSLKFDHPIIAGSPAPAPVEANGVDDINSDDDISDLPF